MRRGSFSAHRLDGRSRDCRRCRGPPLLMDMNATVPRKLRDDDLIRVVAPARSRAFVREHDYGELIEARFEAMGLALSYGEHVDERDEFGSSSIASRLATLHDAFADSDVAAVLTVIGGTTATSYSPTSTGN